MKDHLPAPKAAGVIHTVRRAATSGRCSRALTAIGARPAHNSRHLARGHSPAPRSRLPHHTPQDFEKGFIMADTMSFDDFKEYGSEVAVRAAGKLRQEGRKYETQDGDIYHFKFNVAGGGK